MNQVMANNIKKLNNTSTKDKANELINKILYGLFLAFILGTSSYFLYAMAPEIFRFIMKYIVMIIKKDYPMLN